MYVSDENYKSKSLHEEFESLKNQFQEDYNKKIECLEAQVKELRPNAEQTVALNQIRNQVSSYLSIQFLTLILTKIHL